MKAPRSVAAIITLLGAALWMSMGTTAAVAAGPCVVLGTMQTAAPVYYAVTPGPTPNTFNTPPTNSVPAGTGISMSLLCVGGKPIGYQGGSFTAANPVGNYCDHGAAQLTINGTTYSATWSGSTTWVLTSPSGGGTLEVVPDTLNGQSCITGASGFVVTGTIGNPLGGPAGPSATCGGVGVVNTNPVNLTAKVDASSPITVCARAGVHGGKFTITAPAITFDPDPGTPDPL